MRHGVEPEIINIDQMPLHRNESGGQKTMTVCNESVSVKENNHLTRERCTALTVVSLVEPNPKMEMLFKGKGTFL